MIEVADPITGLLNPPTIVAEAAPPETARLLAGHVRPATVIIPVGDDDAELKALEAAIDAVGSRAIPALRVEGEATADRVGQWLGDFGTCDAFVISRDPALVRRVREACPLVRGIVDFRGNDLWSDDDRRRALLEVRRRTNGALARIALLPGSVADRASVAWLQRLLITTWVHDEPQPGVPGVVGTAALVASGANGIVTAEPERVVRFLATFPPDEPTLARRPLVIGHRGVPALAPENTLEGARLAYDHGADMIENDIHLSEDGILVVHHDDDLGRTVDGGGAIAQHRSTELARMPANRGFEAEYPDARIPTLAGYFEEFSSSDVVHVVEIKSRDGAAVDALVALIREHGVEDQVVVISFHREQIMHLQRLLPGMSVGYLTGGQVDETEIPESLKRVLEDVQPLSTTYNPALFGIGHAFLRAAAHRGITVWPWTFRDRDAFVDMFLAGASGLTTDYSHWASTWLADIEPATKQLELQVGDRWRPRVVATRYDRSSAELDAEVRVLAGAEPTDTVLPGNMTPEDTRADSTTSIGATMADGTGSIRVTAQGVEAIAPGTAWITLRSWQELDGERGRGYWLYTRPLPVRVSDWAAEG